MKKHILILFALLCCCITPAFAYGNYDGNVTAPHWFNTTNAEANAVCAANGKTYTGDYIGVSMYWDDFTHETHIGGLADYDIYAGSFSANTSWVSHYVTCNVSAYSLRYYNNGLTRFYDITSFTGTPTSGGIPLTVSFAAINLTNTSGVTWNFGDGNITTANGGSISHVYPNVGIYTVSMEYTNVTQRDTITKPNYITATQASKEVYLTVVDGKSGLFVNGFTANVKDYGNGLWTNGTPTDGILKITTNTSTLLVANISATGYVSVVESKTTRSDDWPEDWSVTMFKTADQPNSTNIGNTSLRIWVTSSDTGGLSLPGVSVQISDGQAMLTPDSGIAQFTVLNGTSYSWEANKYPDYDGATGVITASGAVTNVNVMLKRSEGNLPTPTSTATIRPTATLTGAALEQHNREQDQAMMNQLRDNGPNIIGLCILVIIFSLIGMLTGGIKKM